MLNDLLSKVGGVLQRRRQERDQSYAGFVLAVADGKKIDAEALAELLEFTGKTVDEFGADVQLLVDRREWKKQLDQAEKLNAENARIGEVIIAEREKFELAIKELRQNWADRHDSLQRELLTVNHHRDLCERARVRLEETSPVYQAMLATQGRAAAAIRDNEGRLAQDRRLHAGHPIVVAQIDAEIARNNSLAESAQRELDKLMQIAHQPI